MELGVLVGVVYHERGKTFLLAHLTFDVEAGIPPAIIQHVGNVAADLFDVYLRNVFVVI